MTESVTLLLGAFKHPDGWKMCNLADGEDANARWAEARANGCGAHVVKDDSVARLVVGLARGRIEDLDEARELAREALLSDAWTVNHDGG